MQGLIVHCGGTKVGRDEVMALPAPRGMTPTHYPISHGDVLRLVDAGVRNLGFEIETQEHAISHDGGRYFGLLALRRAGEEARDYGLTMGLRNSHDQTFPAAYAVGSRVFVCDNLAFSAEVKLARKHTRFISRDLPGLVTKALGRLSEMRVKQDARIIAYKGLELADRDAHDLMVRAVMGGVMAANKLPRLHKEWTEPSHEAFKPRTGWSLFNAATEVLKEYDIQDLAQRTTRLHGLMDQACGIIARN